MPHLSELLARNRAWAARQVAGDPGYFRRLSGIQRPDYLWIGCSDSRVPANQIVDLDPGQMFVHRNVANQAAPGDANGMAAVTYAVEVLRVRGIIVCGHYGCGGVRAALDGDASGVVAEWLRPLADLARAARATLDAEPDGEARWARLCELNVAAQVGRLAATEVVRAARRRDPPLTLHGWIYDLRDGLLRDLGVSDDEAG